ncbi:hypothetical protein BJ742DRAFT_779489 [Cladochytrium replicatum]|nr:hypothetical protein BJ742DRAFT_779489 [Cladochytrium replicatum]
MFGSDLSQPININTDPNFGATEERGSPVPSEASSTATAAPGAPEYYNYGQPGQDAYGGYGYQPYGNYGGTESLSYQGYQQNGSGTEQPQPESSITVATATTRMVAQYTWPIMNYLSQPDEKLVSPVFGPPEHRWQMVAYTKGVSDGRDRYLGVFVRPLRNDKEEAAGDAWSRPIVNFSIKILRGADVIASDTSAETFTAFDARVPGWGFTTLYDLAQISNALTYDGTLTVLAEVCWETLVPATSLTYSWTVPQFQDQANRIALAEAAAAPGQPPQQQLMSYVFGPPDRTWQLYLFPNGDKDARGTWLSCFLHVVPSAAERSLSRWTRSVTSFSLRIRRANATDPLDSVSSKTLTGGYIFSPGSVSCGWTQMFELARLQEAIDWYGGLTMDVEVVWDDEAHGASRVPDGVSGEEVRTLQAENESLKTQLRTQSEELANRARAAEQAQSEATTAKEELQSVRTDNERAARALKGELDEAKRAVEVATLDTGRLATKFAAVTAELEEARRKVAEAERVRERLAEVQQEFQGLRSGAQEKTSLRGMLLGTRAKIAKILARMLTEDAEALPPVENDDDIDGLLDEEDEALGQPVVETKITDSGVWDEGPVYKEIWVDDDPSAIVDRAESGVTELHAPGLEASVNHHGSRTLEDVFTFDPPSQDLVSVPAAPVEVEEDEVYVADAGVNTFTTSSASTTSTAVGTEPIAQEPLHQGSPNSVRSSIVAMLAPSLTYSAVTTEEVAEDKEEDGWDEDAVDLDFSDTEVVDLKPVMVQYEPAVISRDEQEQTVPDEADQSYMGPPRKKESTRKVQESYVPLIVPEQPKEGRRSRVVEYKDTQTGSIEKRSYGVQAVHVERRLENVLVGQNKAVQFTTDVTVLMPPRPPKALHAAELNGRLKREIVSLKAELVSQKALVAASQEKIEATLGEAEVAKLERAEVLLRYAGKKGRQAIKHQRSFSSRKDEQESQEDAEDAEDVDEDEEEEALAEEDDDEVGEGGTYTSVKALRAALEHVRTECAAARVALSDTTGVGESPETEVEKAAMSAELAMVQAELEVARASLVDAETKTPMDVIVSSGDHTEAELTRVKKELSSVLAELMESRARLEDPQALRTLFGNVVKLVQEAGGISMNDCEGQITVSPGPKAANGDTAALQAEVETLRAELSDTKNKMAAARTALEGFGFFAAGGAASTSGSVAGYAGYGSSPAAPYLQGRSMSIASAGAHSSVSMQSPDNQQAYALYQQQQAYYNNYYSQQQGYADGSYAQTYGDGSYGNQQAYGDASYGTQATYGDGTYVDGAQPSYPDGQTNYGAEYANGYGYSGESANGFEHGQQQGSVENVASEAVVDELQIVQAEPVDLEGVAAPVVVTETAKRTIEPELIAPMTEDSTALLERRKSGSGAAGPPKMPSGLPPPPMSGDATAGAGMRARRAGRPGAGATAGLSLPPTQGGYDGGNIMMPGIPAVEDDNPEAKITAQQPGWAPKPQDGTAPAASHDVTESGDGNKSGMWTPVPKDANDSPWGPQARAQDVKKGLGLQATIGSIFNTLLSLFLLSVFASSLLVTTLYASCNPPQGSKFSQSHTGILVAELCHEHVAPAWRSFRGVYEANGGPKWVLDHGHNVLDGASALVHAALPRISRTVVAAKKQIFSKVASSPEASSSNAAGPVHAVVDLERQKMVEEEIERMRAEAIAERDRQLEESRRQAEEELKLEKEPNLNGVDEDREQATIAVSDEDGAEVERLASVQEDRATERVGSEDAGRLAAEAEKAANEEADQRRAQEADRVAAELEAQKEAARLAAEAEAQEAARVAAEAERLAEEVARAAEAERLKVEEAARVASEQEAIAEAARVAAEAERVGAEEAARVAAEAERVAAEEAARVAAEAERVAAAEAERVAAAEAEMVAAAEAARVAAEEAERLHAETESTPAEQVAADAADGAERVVAEMTSDENAGAGTDEGFGGSGENNGETDVNSDEKDYEGSVLNSEHKLTSEDQTSEAEEERALFADVAEELIGEETIIITANGDGLSGAGAGEDSESEAQQ